MHSRPLRAARGLAVVCALGVALVGCGSASPASGGPVAVALIPAADRTSLPPMEGTTLDGSPLALPDRSGRVTVLNAWASWCDPCRRELPVLTALAGRVDPGDVAFVGLNVEDDANAARAMQEEFAVTYPSLVDARARFRLALPGVPPDGLPVTLVLDRQGRIAARIIGEVRAGQLEPALLALAGE